MEVHGLWKRVFIAVMVHKAEKEALLQFAKWVMWEQPLLRTAAFHLATEELVGCQLE